MVKIKNMYELAKDMRFPCRRKGDTMINFVYGQIMETMG